MNTLATPLNKQARTAGAQRARQTLGLEKTAGLLSGLANIITKPVGWATKSVAKPFEWAGKGILSAAGPKYAPYLRTLGKGLPSQMAGFGLFSGALEGSNAMGALVGQGNLGWDWDRARKGFVSGATLGAGFGMGTNAIRAGMSKAIGQNNMTALRSAAERGGWFGGGLKGFGANVAHGAIPFLGADMVMSPMTGGSLVGSVHDLVKNRQPKPPQQYAPQIQTLGGRSLSHMGLAPYNETEQPRLSYAHRPPGMGY